jgi:hypothetical protein
MALSAQLFAQRRRTGSAGAAVSDVERMAMLPQFGNIAIDA